jgi:hypothetical protein
VEGEHALLQARGACPSQHGGRQEHVVGHQVAGEQALLQAQDALVS